MTLGAIPSLAANPVLASWLAFSPGGTVTIFSGKVEYGQGVWTALAQIAAEELDVALARVAVAPVSTAGSPDEGVTSGSLSIQHSGSALRQACAQARALLLAAAAAKLGSTASALTVDDGQILTAGRPTGLSYWSLASPGLLDRKAGVPVPVKPAGRWSVAGRSALRLDLPDKVTGRPRFLHDLVLPGMLYGRVIRPPAVVAELLSAAGPELPPEVRTVRDGSFLGVVAPTDAGALRAARLDDLCQGVELRAWHEGVHDHCVTNDIDTLATALYVRTDDLLKQYPDLAPWRPKIGLQPQLTDAELVTLAVMQALLGYTSEARWIRHAHAHLGHLFPYLPGQPGYNRRLRAAAALITTLIRLLAADTSLWTDDVWVVDSTPVECGRSKETAHRSELAGWAEYGYCASHSRYFWGLRLHLIATLGGLPIGFALTGAKADERQTLLGILAADPALAATRPGQTLIADRQYYGAQFEATLAAEQLTLLRPARKGEPERPGAPLFKPLRQTIESINQTFKAQLDLERHGGHTVAGVTVRILQRILALTAAIWHNDHTGAPIHRSLTAYDH